MMEQIELIHNISRVIISADSYSKALKNVVTHMAEFLESDVCSIYLLNRKKKSLVLSATQGLHEDAIGRVTMSPSEGLTGLAFNSEGYIIMNNASKHSKYKYFPGIGEEPFNTFIGIPLKDHQTAFGVLVFQFADEKEGTPVMEKLLSTVASIVSGMILKFNLMEFTEDQVTEKAEVDHRFQGISLSGGIAIGRPVHVIYSYIESTKDSFDQEQEIQDLNYAFDATKSELSQLINSIEDSSTQIDTEIFHAHLMMVQDGSFKRDMVRHITKYNKGAAFSIRHVSDKFIKKFRSIDDPYLRERAADIEDICERLLTNLGVLKKNTELFENSIVISDRLTPGETASLDMEKVCGFITEKDGPTSHTAILARSRDMPAVSGISNLLERTEATKMIIIDGYSGEIIINPSPGVLESYEKKRKNLDQTDSLQETDSETRYDLSEYGISVHANVSSVLDAQKANSLNADSIGLVRTEIFYLQNQGNFTFETQLELYSQIAKQFTKGPIVFRLLDIGADKKLRNDIKEENPALGMRGLRLLLKNEEILTSQVKALISISDRYPVRILVPFITELSEFKEAKTIIQDIAAELKKPVPPIGAMVEIPSVTFYLEELNQEVDFYSVGTNDLFQYFCAVDRNNSVVSNLYQFDNQPFLRLLDLIYQKTKDSGKGIEICGEIAADASILMKLIDIGYTQFSINPYSIHTTRKTLYKRYTE